ncbi:MAG: response regulator [Anaerolineae bacterium]|nr:response regulator [Anaerolineae bacterium]
MGDVNALIIDDNAKNVDVLARLLAAEGVSSDKVTNPGELETMLDRINQIDIVFLDLELPGTDGYQILAWLKSDQRFQTVPVVAYTVHVSEINVAHQQGFDSFLGKPIRYDRFPSQLRRILRGEQVWETA